MRFLLLAGLLFTARDWQPAYAAEYREYSRLRPALSKYVQSTTGWPTNFNYRDKKLNIKYTFNSQLSDFIKTLLQSYRSDYAAVTVIDNETGNILASVGYSGVSNIQDKNLALTSSHPAASLIKIVTASDLVERKAVNKDSMFEFAGRSTTLYKYQLKNNRYGRPQSFGIAFAKSNNVIFGKAALNYSGNEKLIKMAENYGFNRPLLDEFDSVQSVISPSTDDYEMAELGSGFNDRTRISTIHAAAIASVIANNGILKQPHLVDQIIDSVDGEVAYQRTPFESRVLSDSASREVKEMMEMTIEDGTARKNFRKMNRGLKEQLEIGGKTGSITGGIPFGKRDWFASFAVPKDKTQGKGISISVMNINVKRWHVKSTFLAKEIVEYYYKKINPIKYTSFESPVRRLANSTVKKIGTRKSKRATLQAIRSKRKLSRSNRG